MHGVKSARLRDGKQINILVILIQNHFLKFLLEMKEMSRTSKDNYGCCKEPLLDIELNYIAVE